MSKVTASTIIAAVSLIQSKLVVTDGKYEAWTKGFVAQLNDVAGPGKITAVWGNPVGPTSTVHPLTIVLKSASKKLVALFKETPGGYEFIVMNDQKGMPVAKAVGVRNGKDLGYYILTFFDLMHPYSVREAGTVISQVMSKIRNDRTKDTDQLRSVIADLLKMFNDRGDWNEALAGLRLLNNKVETGMTVEQVGRIVQALLPWVK